VADVADTERVGGPDDGGPDDGRPDGTATDGPDRYAGLPPDERSLLEAFDHLAPQGTLRWNFEDAMRRISSPGDSPSGIEPWPGLPPDLWDRGRGAKASERVLGDVIRGLAQDLTEYTQRTVEGSRRARDHHTGPAFGAVWDALRYLAARVERLEAAGDPTGIRPADLDLPAADAAEWAGALPDWLDGSTGLPVVVGELGSPAVLAAACSGGAQVDAVDPRGTPVWAAWATGSGGDDAGERPGRLTVEVGDVGDHLRGLPARSRSAVVLSGGVDRLGLPERIALLDEAVRVLTPGGTLVLLVTDQAAWDAALAPEVRDLLPGRPFHPATWALLLDRRGATSVEVHPATGGTVHAVVARTSR